MSNHVALSATTHRNLRVRTESAGNLGDAVMACITFPAEFRSVQNHFPILFQLAANRESFSILALFGFENGENLFLQGGKWDARYKPLALAVQPFLIGLPREPGGEKQVHIDLASPRISAHDGTRLFDTDGLPTPLLESMSQKLGDLDAGYQGTALYLAALQKYDLLEPLTLDITLNDGAKNRLVGFHGINEEALQALDGAALADLHAGGHLFPTFMALASLSNIGALVERKNRLHGYG